MWIDRILTVFIAKQQTQQKTYVTQSDKVPSPDAVSYTHLDVYKRQIQGGCGAISSPILLGFSNERFYAEA